MFRVSPIFSQKFARMSISTQQCGAHHVACQNCNGVSTRLEIYDVSLPARNPCQVAFSDATIRANACETVAFLGLCIHKRFCHVPMHVHEEIVCVLRHSRLLRCLSRCGRRLDFRGVSSQSLLTLDMFRVRAMVCLVVVFVCGRWAHAISSGWYHCARSSGQVR